MKTDWNGQEMTLVVLRDVNEAVRLRKELQQLSLTDDLTGLYNRRGFMMFAARAVHTARRQHHRLFVLFADLDGLKKINDTMGHQVGDKYLEDTATILKDSFRDVDIIARMGGDEYAVLGSVTDEFIPQTLVQRLEESIAAHNRASPEAFPLAMSTGLSTFDPATPEPIEDVIDRADEAMYQQKKAKPNRDEGGRHA
jgi:diguanylate cyclase (GGDEF)-like protein